MITWSVLDMALEWQLSTFSLILQSDLEVMESVQKLFADVYVTQILKSLDVWQYIKHIADICLSAVHVYSGL